MGITYVDRRVEYVNYTYVYILWRMQINVARRDSKKKVNYLRDTSDLYGQRALSEYLSCAAMMNIR